MFLIIQRRFDRPIYSIIIRLSKFFKSRLSEFELKLIRIHRQIPYHDNKIIDKLK